MNRTHMSGGRGRVTRAAMAVAMAGFVTAGFGVRAGASDAGETTLATYQVLARADAFTVEMVDSSAPAVPGGEVVKASPATSQSVVNSLGQSVGFASAPYPGDFIISGPGTFNGVRPPGAPELPYYPFVAYSSFPGEPKAEAAQGPYRLKATSEHFASAAEAEMAAAGNGQPAIARAFASTKSVVDSATGELTALADSTMDGLAIGPLIIGHVAGHAKMVAGPGQNPSKETAFSVGTVTIAGTTVGFTDKGLQMAGGAAAVPDISALSETLSTAGITLTYVPSTQTPTSIESAGLAVGYNGQIPGQGPRRFVVTLGRVRAEVASTTALQFDVSTGSATPDSTSGDASTSVTTPTEDGSAWSGGSLGVTPIRQDTATFPAAELVGGDTAGSPQAPEMASVPGPSQEQAAFPSPAPHEPATAALAGVSGFRQPRRDGDSRVYLVFPAGAAALLAMSAAFSRRALSVSSR